MADCITTTATIKNKVSAKVNVKIAINGISCPIITCIDGGNASTPIYPAVNGLINGGGA